MIEVKNISKTFKEKKVLKNVSFEIPDGSTFTIIGGSGQGKSVIIKHLFGYLMPDSGKVLVDGTDLSTLSKNELFEMQKNFGIVFQGAALFDSLNVEENVGFGLKWIKNMDDISIKKIVKSTLEKVNLSVNILKQKPSELSGGMKKRVAIARAICYNPKYILYDEPTTGLDPLNSDVINNLILHLKKTINITSIVVTHDMKTAAKVSDDIVMLNDGEIIERGNPEKFMKTDNEIVKKFIKGEAD